MESAGLVEFEGKTVKEALYHYKGPSVFDNVNKKQLHVKFIITYRRIG